VRARESSARRGEGHVAEHLSANDRYRFIRRQIFAKKLDQRWPE
jgi:hypothetical protein